MEDASRIWRPDFLGAIASNLQPNDIALLRLVDRSAATQFAHHTELRLSMLVPHWAFAPAWSRPGACRALTRDQRAKLTTSVATVSDVANLQAALAAAEFKPDWRHREAAASGGYMPTCCWLMETQVNWQADDWQRVLKAGASSGHRSVCEWCLGPGRGGTALRSPTALCEAASSAARGGHVGLMTWLLQLAEKLAEAEAEAEAGAAAAAAAGAAAGGAVEAPAGAPSLGPEVLRTDLLRAAFQGCDQPTAVEIWGRCGMDAPHSMSPTHWAVCWRRALKGALRSPSAWREKAEWLLAQAGPQPDLGDPQSVRELFWAAVEPLPGQDHETTVPRLQWLRDQGASPDLNILAHAIKCRHRPAVRWLVAEGVVPDSYDTCTSVSVWLVAMLDDLGMLQEMRQCTTLWRPWMWRSVVQGAVAGGRTRVLTWVEASLTRRELHATCINYGTYGTLNDAIESGSLDSMRWALSHGCVPKEEAWVLALRAGCEATLDFMAEVGCPQPMMGEPYQEAIQRGEMRLLQALRRAGVPVGPSRNRLYALALKHRAPAEVLRWLETEVGVDPQAAAAEAEAEAGDSQERVAEQRAQKAGDDRDWVEARAEAGVERRRRGRERERVEKRGRRREQA